MNLIEQLGGYERAKAFLNAASYTMDELIMMQRSGLRTQHVEKALLQYRRQHNIYEAGDLVIKTHPKNTILWPVLGVYKNGGVWLDYKGFCWKPPRVRHATDEEIKAGKRLEVNDGY